MFTVMASRPPPRCCGLQPGLRSRLHRLIRRAAGPQGLRGFWVPNRSEAINNSPISGSGPGSDVAARASVKSGVRIGEAGALWFWFRAMGLCSGSLCQDFENTDEMMRSYVFIWRWWSRWKYLKAFLCAFITAIFPYVFPVDFTSEYTIRLLFLTLIFRYM